MSLSHFQNLILLPASLMTLCAYAHDEGSNFSGKLTEYCFEREVSFVSVKRHLWPILLRGDELLKGEKGNCVKIFITPERVELFKKFLAKKYKVTTVNVMSSTTEGESQANIESSCRFRIDFQNGKHEWTYVRLNKKRSISLADTNIDIMCSKIDTFKTKVQFFHGKKAKSFDLKEGDVVNLKNLLSEFSLSTSSTDRIPIEFTLIK